MAKLQWPGDENKNEETRFRFQCKNFDCEQGRAKFHAVYDEPGPMFVPSGMDCPFCDDHAVWVMDGLAATHVRGQAAGVKNPHYTPQLAEAEHKWMGLQIEETRKAVEGQDQIDGTAASPYGKYELDKEEALKRGVIKKASEEQAAERNRIMDERAKKVAEQAADKIDREIEQRHIGRRHDG